MAVADRMIDEARRTEERVHTWLMSAATPGVPTTSYSDSCDTRGLSFMRRPRGWPMPPAAPTTTTFLSGAAAAAAEKLLLASCSAFLMSVILPRAEKRSWPKTAGLRRASEATRKTEYSRKERGPGGARQCKAGVEAGPGSKEVKCPGGVVDQIQTSSWFLHRQAKAFTVSRCAGAATAHGSPSCAVPHNLVHGESEGPYPASLSREPFSTTELILLLLWTTTGAANGFLHPLRHFSLLHLIKGSHELPWDFHFPILAV